MTEQYANGATTTLNGAINNSTTSITVTSATGFPSTAPFRILVRTEGGNGNELMLVTAGAGTTSWTVTRAVEPYGGSSSASSHSNGATVVHVITRASLAAATGPKAFTVVVDGGGTAITGNPEIDLVPTVNGTITSWTILADVSGSAVFDIWKDTYANFPPTVGDSITASAKPTLSSATKATSSTLTGWTTTFTAGDIFRFHLDSSSTVKRLTLVVQYERTP